MRPLIHEEGKNPSDISRKDEVFVSFSGLITIAGGKLTGYRKMADKVVTLVMEHLDINNQEGYGVCQTATLPLSGGDVGGSEQFDAFVEQQIQSGVVLGMTEAEARKVARTYGSNTPLLYELLEGINERQDEGALPLPLLGALLYGMEHEMTVTPVDFFMRRTGMLLFNVREVQQWKKVVIQYMATYLHWSHEQAEQYQTELEQYLGEASQHEIYS